jgi:hypothetical protein
LQNAMPVCCALCCSAVYCATRSNRHLDLHWHAHVQ